MHEELLLELRERVSGDQLLPEDALIRRLVAESEDVEGAGVLLELLLLTLLVFLRGKGERQWTSFEVYKEVVRWLASKGQKECNWKFEEVDEARRTWEVVLDNSFADGEEKALHLFNQLLGNCSSLQDTLMKPHLSSRGRLPLLTLLLSSTSSTTRALIQMIFDSPLAITHLKNIVMACPALVEPIISDMYDTVQSHAVLGNGLLSSSDDENKPKLLSFDEKENTVTSPLERYFSCLLWQLCYDNNTLAKLIRRKLSFLKFSPELCLRITETHIGDAMDYISSHIPYPSLQNESAVTLNSHWLVSALSLERCMQLSQGLSRDFVKNLINMQKEIRQDRLSSDHCSLQLSEQDVCVTVRRWSELVRHASQYFRVTGVLVASTSVDLISNKHSSNQETAEETERLMSLLSAEILTPVYTAIQDLSDTSTDLVSQMCTKYGTVASLPDQMKKLLSMSLRSLFHIRTLAFIMHLMHFAYCSSVECSRAKLKQNTQQNVSIGQSLASTPLQLDADREASLKHVLEHMARLLISPINSIIHQSFKDSKGEVWDAYSRFLYFPFYIKACISMECMPPLQKVANSFLGLHKETCLPIQTHSHLLICFKHCLPQCPSISPVLLQRDLQLLVSEYFLLPDPCEICAETEYPGDWVWGMNLLLGSRYLTCSLMLQHKHRSIGEENLSSSQTMSLRTVMIKAMRSVSLPLHSCLQDVIDIWLRFTIEGPDSPSAGAAKPFRTSLVPIFPDEIIENVKPAKKCGTWWCDSVTWSPGFSALNMVEYINDGGNCGKDLAIVDAKDLIAMMEISDIQDDHHAYFSGCTDFLTAAISSYVALKYRAICERSCVTSYATVFSCSTHDLPLRFTLALLLYNVKMCSPLEVESTPHTPFFTLETERGHRWGYRRGSYCYSSSLAMFNSIFKLTLQYSPELLIRERILPIARVTRSLCSISLVETETCLAASTLPQKGAQSKSHLQLEQKSTSCIVDEGRCVIWRGQSMLLKEFMLALVNLSSEQLVAVVLSLLHEFLDAISCYYSCNIVSNNSTRKIDESEVNMRADKVQVVTQYSIQLWKRAHALLPNPARLELATVNLLLEIGEQHRPRCINTYDILVEEPLVLFRLPVCILRIPLALHLVSFIYRSVSVASGRAAAESAIRKQLRSANEKNNWTLKSETDGENGKGATSRVYKEDNLVSSEEFLTTQNVIVVRILLELWVEVRRLSFKNLCHDNEDLMNQREKDSFEVSKGLQYCISDLAGIITDLISNMAAESPSLVNAVLLFGVPQWTSFRLLASCPIVLDGIAKNTHKLLNLSLLSEYASPLSSTSTSLELWLWHVIFLLKVHRLQMSTSSIANNWISDIAESLHAFFKETCSYSWWMRTPLAKSNIGTQPITLKSTCQDLLIMLSHQFPYETIRILQFFSSSSVPSSHVLSSLQHVDKGMSTLFEDISRNFDPESCLLKVSRKRGRTEI